MSIVDCRLDALSGFRSPRGLKPAARLAFSLVEMMIAIVILGLGLVMVATMFPVAWDRARTLSEYTVEQSATAAAQTTLHTLLRPASHSLVAIPGLPVEESRLTSGSLAGDLFFDPTLPEVRALDDRYLAILAFSDTNVHALNVENMLLVSDDPVENPLGLVAEEPWDLEDPGPNEIVQDRFQDLNYPNPEPRNRGMAFPDQFFYHPQVRAWQRLHPPMEAPPTTGEVNFEEKLNQWNERLATRRFCWAVLHRLRSRVGPAPLPVGVTPTLPESDEMVRQAAAAAGSSRSFDVYYVTLRRPRPTNRYARQDPDPSGIPNPFDLSSNTTPVQPAALEFREDVMFPVAWRVQVEFPASLLLRASASGVPTEVHVPQAAITGETARMLVQMFPVGTQFIDEISGSVYRVAKRRIVDGSGELAALTLDREVVLEDIDLPPGDPRCDNAVCQPGTIVAEECLRTVWVFPPPVDSADRLQNPNNQTPQFDGPSPIVDIQVGTLNITPSS